MMDYLIKDATLVDGSGDPAFRADIAVSGDRISMVKACSGASARTVIEAAGKIVCPGFIDMHSHSDVLFSNGDLISHKVFQGVTTEIIGQDGISAAPLTSESIDFMAEIIEPLGGKVEGGWQPWDMDGFLCAIARRKADLNVMTLTGHCNLRMAAMGHTMAAASDQDLKLMGSLLAKSFEQGSAGLSLGLIYPPSSYSNVDELIHLGKTVKQYDGIMVSHIRNEMDKVLDALEEMIAIGEESGCKIHISHLKCMGKSNWGKMPQILARIDKALNQGVAISFDQYPYDASSTSLSLLLPGWAMEGGWQGFKKTAGDPAHKSNILSQIQQTIHQRGGAGAITIASVQSDNAPNLTGRTILELSRSRGISEAETVFDILYQEQLRVIAIYHAMDETDVECAMTHPLHTVGSDGVLGDFPHPRAYGTFPRILQHYCGERRLFPLEKAIRKMTSTPAKVMGIKDRGCIKEGQYADLLIFEKDKFIGNATYNEPKQFASGLEWVFLNGKPLIENGVRQKSFPGYVLKKESLIINQ